MPESNLDLLNKNWQPGRKFRVRVAVYTDGTTFDPRLTYMVATQDYAQRTDGAMFFVSLAGKTLMADTIAWLPDGLSFELSLLIKKHPESKYIPGFVRQEIGTAPTKKSAPKTEEGWMKFVDKTREDNKKKLEAQVKKTVPTVAAPAPAPVMVPVRVKAVENLRGTGYFTRRDMLAGDVPVPKTILLTGEARRVRDYIYDHMRDHLTRRQGDMEYTDCNVDESDGLDITVDNVRDVMATVAHEARLATEQENITITRVA